MTKEHIEKVLLFWKEKPWRLSQTIELYSIMQKQYMNEGGQVILFTPS